MKKFKFLLPVTLILLLACNNKAGENHDNHDDQAKTEKLDQHEESENAVQLDNGKKWKANPETITGINNMTALVQNGIAANMQTAKLHDTLQIEFKTIFDKCTMTGESHNQLHNFLIPLKRQLEKLKAGNSETETLKDIKEHLLTFSNYFE